MDLDPRKITPHEGRPLNRLMLAINHWISTGDHFGEGVGLPEGDRVRVLIPVNRAMKEDVEDFERFRARFDEIAPGLGLTLDDQGPQGTFHMYSILIAESDMDRLAQTLTREPGPLGWGSPKALIDEHRLG